MTSMLPTRRRSRPRGQPPELTPPSLADLQAFAQQVSLDELAQVAEQTIRAQHADNTRKAYDCSWALFCEFCQRRGFCALPASPVAVVYFLAERALAGRKTSTITSDKCAIRHHHLNGGYPDPTNHPDVYAVLTGHRKHLAKQGVVTDKKAALMTEDVRKLCVFLDAENTLMALRNKAYVLISYGGALRVSEAVRRTISEVEISSEGAIIFIPHSKTDQNGDGQLVGICRAPNAATCPVTVLETWLQAMKTLGVASKSAPLFPALHDNRVGGRSQPRVLGRHICEDHARILFKAACRAAGIPAENLSTHSMRRGHITQALANDATFVEALKQGRWRDPKTLLEYWDRVHVLRQNSSRHLWV